VIPSEWLLFSRYDRCADVAYGVASGGVYVARIVGAQRR
jgi:hypothetical protein